MHALFRGLYSKAGAANKQSTVTSMVGNFLPIVDCHFITRTLFQLLFTCTYAQTHPRFHTHPHSSTDNYTIKAALDIPKETCIATSNVPT